MNEADSRRLAAHLEKRGYRPVNAANAADLVVVNTCVVRQLAEDKAVQRLMALRHLKKDRPGMVIGVMGCLVGFRPNDELPKLLPFVDVFMPPSDFRPLLKFLDSRPNMSVAVAYDARTAPENQDAWLDDFPSMPPSVISQTASAFVPAVLGCSFACAFCVIPYRRGAERSRLPQAILDEIRRLADSGIREVTLLGQIIDRYGLDLGNITLQGLLREAVKIPGIVRVRFLTSHPNWFTDDLLDVMVDSEKICPQIELPVQAGNDVVLERMRRGYTVNQYRRLVEKIRDRIPDCGLFTDVIVGFPGETDKQFMDTYRLMEELQPDMIRIAKYSERPQTYAARYFPDDVPEHEKERRRAMLDDLLEQMLLKKHADWMDGEVEILVDHREKDGRWCGRTRQGKLVFFRDDHDWLGRMARVRLSWVAAFSLAGEVLTETSPAMERV